MMIFEETLTLESLSYFGVIKVVGELFSRRFIEKLAKRIDCGPMEIVIDFPCMDQVDVPVEMIACRSLVWFISRFSKWNERALVIKFSV